MPQRREGRVARSESGRPEHRALPLSPGGDNLASKISAIWGMSAKGGYDHSQATVICAPSLEGSQDDQECLYSRSPGLRIYLDFVGRCGLRASWTAHSRRRNGSSSARSWLCLGWWLLALERRQIRLGTRRVRASSGRMVRGPLAPRPVSRLVLGSRTLVLRASG